MNDDTKLIPSRSATALAALLTATLAACSGGTPTAATAPAATTTTALTLQVPAAPVDAPAVTAQPAFHVAPVALDEPDDTDAIVNNVSAAMEPHVTTVPANLAHLSTKRLTRETIDSALTGAPSAKAMTAARAAAADPSATPMATGSVVATYSPAQVRAAYGLPALPAAGAALSATQAAQLGAGQTVYIVDSNHNPNVAAELNAFNQKFGLGGCTLTPIATNAALPLAPPPTTGCVLSVVYTTAAGAMTATAPAYDSGWSTEISLDVQWVHATAPLARIVLLEAPDATTTSLSAAVNLANAMGPGVVSMSFGASEGSYTAYYDSSFSTANMTYVASSGDSGAGVSWPAVSTKVLAVGGTSLTYTGSGPRSETAWSGSGGGTSAYTATPTYQTSAVPGMGTPVRRNVPDVSFNANPSTGQYVAVIAQGSTNVGWLSAGGTSLSAPQWAGMIAVANAMRLQSGKAPLGAPHTVLYGQVASSTTNYPNAFADIVQGSNGTCATCAAKPGYDTVTGLGTPNESSLLPLVSGASIAATAPTVGSGSISGTTGIALSFSVSASAPNALTYALSGAPAGMTISSAGVIGWSAPVAGTYTVTVTATDSVTHLSGKGTYTIAIAAPSPPLVISNTVSGNAGTALNVQVGMTTSNPVTVTMSGAPAGATISNTGVLTWPNPIQGTYTLIVTAKDTKTGLSGQGTIKLSIAPALAPVVAGATLTGKTGAAFSFTVSVTNANPVTYKIAGAPSGMTINGSGVVSWPTPIVGTYSVTVTAADAKTGLSGQGLFKITIAAPGPVITAAPINGVAGKALSGTITLADPGATSLSMTISGVPAGMSFVINGLTVTANWPMPVTGSYKLLVTVKDNANLSAQASVPVTITAK